MSKKVLTGGTGDVSPQWMNLGILTLSAANTYTEQQVVLPVTRFGARKGRSIVLEFLEAEFLMPEWDTNPAAGGNLAQAVQQLSTISQTAANAQSSRIIQYANASDRGAFTAGGSYFSSQNGPMRFDLTDHAGHGMLVATDVMFWGCVTSNFAAAAPFVCRILYRFKEVSLEEYIGIVQSQQ